MELDAFYRQAKGLHGRASECKSCFNNRTNDRYRTSPRARAKVLTQHAKVRAEKKGIAFELTIDWVHAAILAGSCQVTGLPFDLTLASMRNLYGPSLDRADPSKGYTKENTKVVLFGYNACKNAASVDEAIAFFHAVSGALS